MGRFFLWCFSFALLGNKGKARVFMLCLSVCGVSLSQSLGAVIGLVLLVLVYQLLSKRLGGGWDRCFVYAIAASGFLVGEL